MDVKGFTEVLSNCVYALHDYSTMGFLTGEPYKGTDAQKQLLAKQFARKSEFHGANKVPVWNGEFGPVYETNAEHINQQRYSLLGEQLKIYDKAQISWSIWLYKDIGLQGMVHTSPDSPWNRLIEPWLDKKTRLQLDSWGKYPSEEVEKVMAPLIERIDKVSPTAKDQYPTNWTLQKHLDRAVLQTFLSDSLQMEFAELFKGKDKAALEELAMSFHFDQCVQREGLNKIMSEHAKLMGS
jgi:hypothetical protein